MSDRSAQERAAARRERELRRAEREGRRPAELPPVEPPAPAPAQRPPSPAPETAAEGPPAEPEVPVEPPEVAHPAPVSPPPAASTPALSGAAPRGPRSSARPPNQEDTGPETGEYDFETGEHEFEAPAGTRRVSHRDSLAARAPARTGRGRGPRGLRGGGGDRPPGERRRRPWLGRVASVLALAIAAGLIWFLIQLLEPFHGTAHGRVTVVIPAKSTSSQIGDLLAHDGVIASSFFFELRATLAGERSDLRPGVYHLQLGMSYGAALAALTKAPPAAKVSELTITEGRTRNYVAARLKAEHLGSGYLAATRHSALIAPGAYGLRKRPLTLEGFLFPDTYQLIDPIKVSALVTDQLKAFKANFARVNLSYARRKRLTPYDVVKIASLIEAEAASARDRPLVASVVYNRLADGMLLQFDSTTRFATGNYTRPLTVSQLHSRSPWNTHTHPGLPPTPIDSPGLAALQAAAHPAQTKYLFFFARRCGRATAFASTYSRFLNLAAQDQHTRC